MTIRDGRNQVRDMGPRPADCASQPVGVGWLSVAPKTGRLTLNMDNGVGYGIGWQSLAAGHKAGIREVR